MISITLDTLLEARDSLVGRTFVDAEGVILGKFVRAYIKEQTLVGTVELNRRGRKMCCQDKLDVAVLRATAPRKVKVGRM